MEEVGRAAGSGVGPGFVDVGAGGVGWVGWVDVGVGCVGWAGVGAVGVDEGASMVGVGAEVDGRIPDSSVEG